jgi:small subunit ribosomal protein S15
VTKKIFLKTFCTYKISLTFAAIKNLKEAIPFALKEIKMSITKEKKISIFTQFGGAATNTGSTEAQVALLTERILDISKHLQANKKDFSSQKGLIQLVGERKALLSYMQKTNLMGYRALIEKLGLRK